MMKAKKFILKKQFREFPKDTDVEIVDEELPKIQKGEFMAAAVYISVDPYQRAHKQNVGDVLMGAQVAKIMESKLEGYSVGQYVVANFGWRTHTVSKELKLPYGVLPDFGQLPVSLSLGMLGMPGVTAYFGLLEVCKPKKDETVVISAAGGAVGTHVGQIAKLMGCNVIGILGDDDKGKYITTELGYDHYINYKKGNLKEELMRYAPNGIDCYFDNVGGEVSATVIHLMNNFGRISACGCIHSYNVEGPTPTRTSTQEVFILKQLRMEGYLPTRWAARWTEAVQQNLKWLKEGKLKYKETVTEGFENTLQAFVDMLRGKNCGKAVVKI